MANPWFRMYSEFMHDPKVQMLSEQDQRRLVMIFCMRCNSDVTLQDKHVTFTLRISDQEWALTKASFIASGFIDSDNNVLNWDKRQFISDSSAARVAKHRALHKPVTVTQSNVTVTSPEQNRTEQKHKKQVTKYSDKFIEFWEAWPSSKRKGAQGKCWEVWKRENLDSVSQVIIAHVLYCKGNGVWKDPEYISAPLVYLNQRKWEGAEIKSGQSELGNFV